MSALPRQRGQASVELLGLLPLIALIALVALTFVASHAAGEQAGEAAEAGALAILQGGADPRTAASEALPAATRSRSTITLSGARVRVRVRPVVSIPGLAPHLTAEAEAVAAP